MTLTAPPVALRPYSVPCGPRSTSTRCTSKNSVSYRRGFLTGIELKCCSTPESQFADAADLEVRAGEVRFCERDIRHVQLQVGRLIDLPALQRLAAEGGDRDRHIDQVLFASLRGDDDDVDDLSVLGCLRIAGPSTSQSRSDSERERSRASYTDVIPRAHQTPSCC